MKKFFRKYLHLPISYLLAGMPVPYKDYDKYEQEMSKIVDALMSDGVAYARLNGQLIKISKIDKNGGYGTKNITIEKVQIDPVSF
jgi:hypothetical protein